MWHRRIQHPLVCHHRLPGWQGRTIPLLGSYIFHSSFNYHKCFHTFLTLIEKNCNLNKSIEPWKLDSNLCGSLETWYPIPTDTHFCKHWEAITWWGFSRLQHTVVPSRKSSEWLSLLIFMMHHKIFFLLLLCLQYSYSVMFLNLNLFSRSSIQLSNAIVPRIYDQIIVFQVLFFSAFSFASAFCNLKPIFLLWSYKLYHSM